VPQASLMCAATTGDASIYLNDWLCFHNLPVGVDKNYTLKMAMCDALVRKTFMNLELFLQKVRLSVLHGCISCLYHVHC